ncbi:transcriptional regulator [Staphylococcus petrasii]|uniref:HTH-type transcriptional regulator n=1 Tax=Staphylococcus petrasii TaxID=1276936 RepID=A0A380FXA9_9STAP|nr:GbsR/MarR family transcriptional regulator [Staphylococcus petrasii]PNZ25454.1 GbsR/MarR family transcriptional regulator [Staphylococcus petrasii]TGE13705.1 GbsR/MarR family transcriptional regulator [Staphylococcus petrasii]TGE18141.1 GbsR/MarR family transcriptional regulator [Staphylococcus petrasii]SUM42886.1 transcriptional regulator [Staphylococcus petrasii]
MARSKNYDQKIEEAKDLVINSIGETMDLYGTNRSVGNLYGTMVFEGSMTLDEMREQLQMSKPSMSAGVKKLQEFDIVKQQFTRGSRKQHFIAEKNFFNFFRNFFTQKWEREVDTNLEAVNKAEALLQETLQNENLDDEAKAKVDKIQAQLNHTKQYCKWLENLSNAIESGQIFEHYPIPEDEEK